VGEPTLIPDAVPARGSTPPAATSAISDTDRASIRLIEEPLAAAPEYGTVVPDITLHSRQLERLKQGFEDTHAGNSLAAEKAFADYRNTSNGQALVSKANHETVLRTIADRRHGKMHDGYFNMSRHDTAPLLLAMYDEYYKDKPQERDHRKQVFLDTIWPLYLRKHPNHVDAEPGRTHYLRRKPNDTFQTIEARIHTYFAGSPADIEQNMEMLRSEESKKPGYSPPSRQQQQPAQYSTQLPTDNHLHDKMAEFDALIAQHPHIKDDLLQKKNAFMQAHAAHNQRSKVSSQRGPDTFIDSDDALRQLDTIAREHPHLAAEMEREKQRFMGQMNMNPHDVRHLYNQGREQPPNMIAPRQFQVQQQQRQHMPSIPGGGLYSGISQPHFPSQGGMQGAFGGGMGQSMGGMPMGGMPMGGVPMGGMPMGGVQGGFGGGGMGGMPMGGMQGGFGGGVMGGMPMGGARY
jgi:hypothetical protein